MSGARDSTWFDNLSLALRFELLATAITIPASILLNRSLGPTDRGRLALISIIPTYLFVVGSFQWDRIAKAAIAQGEISALSAWKQTLRLTPYISLLTIPIGVAASLFAPSLRPGDSRISAAYCLAMPLAFLAGSLASIILVSGSVEWYGRLRVAAQLIYLSVVASFAAMGAMSISIAIIAQCALYTTMIGFAVMAKRRLLRSPTTDTTVPLRRLIHGAGPYALETLSPRVEAVAFAGAGGATFLGTITAFSGLLQPIGLLSASIVNASTAHVDWRNPVAVTQHLRRSLGVLGLVGIVATIAVLLFGHFAVSLLLGEAFATESRWLLLALATSVLTAAGNQALSTLQLFGKLRSYLLVQSLDPVVRMMMGVAGGLAWGLKGVAAGFVLASILRVVLGVFFVQHHVRRSVTEVMNPE